MKTQTVVLLGVLAAALGGFYIAQQSAASEERLEKLQAAWTATQVPTTTEPSNTGEIIGTLWNAIF